MADHRPTLAHRVQYLLFRGAGGLVRLAGERAGDAVGAALARLGYAPLGIRRKVVESQLRQAFPERDDAWIRRTAQGCYAHLGREAMTMLRLASARPGAVLERWEWEDLKLFQAAVARSGVVLVTGHIGSWELGAAMVAALGMPIDVVVQRQANPLFDARINATRQRLGMTVIDRGEAPRRALRGLRQGHVVAFVADQNAGRGGVFVPFFGRLASTHRSPAVLALRAGVPLFFSAAIRLPGSRYRTRFQEVVVDREGSVDEVVERLTAAFTRQLEAVVRQVPEQYLWQHRRWKTRPEGESQTGAPAEPRPRGPEEPRPRGTV